MELEQKMGNNNNNGNFKAKEDMGVAVHSQVRKIKHELEQSIDWSPGQPEMRPVLREISRHQLSRSRLGLSGRPISVGHL
ncbi:hypothetical protein QUC31_007303 [Theobroma cacao]|uniref:Uncharacterized protein n=1 Tax=Theobroma cacao TaxID=3641 RepID=A0A061FWH6_THECC|nr:Uncharacterized protein TCM_012957 [Theobroma cacao]WRX17483.1 hypothetical protein QQP08_009970 [Theobroma cacao]